MLRSPRISAPRPDQRRRKLALVVMREAGGGPRRANRAWVFAGFRAKSRQTSGGRPWNRPARPRAAYGRSTRRARGRSGWPEAPGSGRPAPELPMGDPPGGRAAGSGWPGEPRLGFCRFPGKMPANVPRTGVRRSRFASQLPPLSGPDQRVLAVHLIFTHCVGNPQQDARGPAGSGGCPPPGGGAGGLPGRHLGRRGRQGRVLSCWTTSLTFQIPSRFTRSMVKTVGMRPFEAGPTT
jgi:hypothetical protein